MHAGNYKCSCVVSAVRVIYNIYYPSSPRGRGGQDNSVTYVHHWLLQLVCRLHVSVAAVHTTTDQLLVAAGNCMYQKSRHAANMICGQGTCSDVLREGCVYA
jgi:hypothetical protein